MSSAKYCCGRVGTIARRTMFTAVLVSVPCATAAITGAQDNGTQPSRDYINRLTPVTDPQPLLGDHPDFVRPVQDVTRFEAPSLIDDREADLSVRAWRWSYNARGIVEIPNQLAARHTAVIVVHPWGIDDGQGWRTPEPAGCAFQCTPQKNRLVRRHAREVINPLLRRLRDRVALVMYSLPGNEDPIRRKLYRSYAHQPGEQDRIEGAKELAAVLGGFRYEGEALPETIRVSADYPVIDYFRRFPGLDAGDRYNQAGFWQLPVPVMKDIDVAPRDVVIYDADGYEALRDFLREQKIRHVLLAGYNTDMCVCSTTAGYENLRRDFNVFLVGDATIATFPANSKPAYSTNAAVSFASLNLLITQSSWIKLRAGGNRSEAR